MIFEKMQQIRLIYWIKGAGIHSGSTRFILRDKVFKLGRLKEVGATPPASREAVPPALRRKCAPHSAFAGGASPLGGSR